VQRHPGPGGRSAPTLQRRCVDDRHAPELPRVGESERGPVFEEDLTAHVALIDIVDAVEELAGHPERDNERLTAVQVENDELPATSHAADPPAPKPRRYDLGRLGLGQTDPAGLEVADRPVHDELPELARDRFDLG